MAELLKSEILLPLEELDEEVVVFGMGGEGDESTTALAVHRSRWEEMGRPSEVTVTVRPGDHLND